MDLRDRGRPERDLAGQLGGHIADRYHPRRALSLLFLLSALSCITIPMVNRWIGTGNLLEDLTWPTRIFWHLTITFLMPATLLGTMSPVVAKMALNLGRAPGRTIGTIYAWGAIGSIVGTFAAGFFLIAWAGTSSAIMCVSAILAVVGIIYGHRSWVPYAGSTALLVFSVLAIGPWAFATQLGMALGIRETPEAGVIFDVDSQYQRVSVRESGSRRTLVLDALVHSKIDLSQPDRLKYDYELVYAEVLRRSHPGKGPLNAFFIGGGGFVFPRYLEEARPGSTIAVAEIDPLVTRVALEMFGISPDSTIRPIPPC